MTMNSSIPTLVLAEFFLPQVGGSINWLVSTYRRYPKGEVVVVAPKCEEGKKTDCLLPFPVERLPVEFSGMDPTEPASLYRYIQAFRHVRKICRRYHIKQIHCAKILPEGLIALCIRNIFSIPYIVYAHGEEIQIGRTSRTLSWLMPKVYNGAAAIIANSRNTKSLLERIGVRSDNIRIIHPGVDPALVESRKDLGRRIRDQHQLGQSPVLLIVGRLQRRKGQDMLIKSLPTIQKVFPETKCLVVGAGNEEASLKHLAQEVGVAKSVIFTGLVGNRELLEYYAACDLFVMPNRQIGEDIEGFGIVYLEAAVMGKAVIGGKSGGTDDAIVEGVTGLRVDGAKVEDISSAVISLLADPEKARAMGENGRRRVEKEFSWDSVFQQTRLLASTIHKG